MRRPTGLDSQKLIVQTLRAAASDLHDRRQALGQLGYSSDYLDGVNNAVRYLLLEAQEIEEGGEHDTKNL